MKKVLSALLAAVMMLSLVACGSAPGANTSKQPETSAPVESANTDPTTAPKSDKLVIYSAGDQVTIDAWITPFEEKYGIDVEVVSAGTGELMKRIEAESKNPLGDVEFGGTVSVCLPYADYFEPYTSVNEDAQIESCKQVAGCITPYDILPVCFVVNKDLIGDIEINGFADLLKPELKGQIAFVDPAQSSTGLQHLTAILQAMGGEDEEKGWEYVEKFVENLDGRMLSSSSAIGQGVADGEFLVGLTHEGYITALQDNGYNVEAIFPEEGMFVSAGVAQIIKGAKNMENAKLFIDYITSKEAQVYAGQVKKERGTRDDIPSPEGLKDISGANVMIEDVQHSKDNAQSYLERFKELYTK